VTLLTARSAGRRVTLAAAADGVAVLVFVALGRGSHAKALDPAGVLTTGAPFLLGALAGWLGARAWRRPLAVRTGTAVWLATVVVGLGVRAAFTHRLPPTFVLITAATMAQLQLGWRGAALAAIRVRCGSAQAAGA
jgi:Protein of unknown function (DUF3054)